MPNIDAVRDYYEQFRWPATTEYWAREWGGTDAQWLRTIAPRVSTFLPANTILEIGPGAGRLSVELSRHCRRLILSDLSDAALHQCEKQLSFWRNSLPDTLSVSFLKTDGMRFPEVADVSIDFAFSLYSLIHGDLETMNSVVAELSRLLTSDGVAFIHHSNAGALGEAPNGAGPDFDRDRSVSAQTIQRACTEHGLQVRSQELLSWPGCEALSDCFSVIVRPWSKHYMPMKTLVNHGFAEEAESSRRLSAVYGRLAYAQ